MNEQPAGLGDICRVFLKIGAMSYGGPAIMGIMQTEVQERRQWVGKERFVEGLALVNMLPGPGATQLAIFIGHDKGGIAGGILAGICFIVPAFAIMLALAGTYAAFGTLVPLRNAFYGIGPVVVGIFAVAVYRLGRATIKEPVQIAVVVASVAILLWTPLGPGRDPPWGGLRGSDGILFETDGLGCLALFRGGGCGLLFCRQA